jgi:hypothetical protein
LKAKRRYYSEEGKSVERSLRSVYRVESDDMTQRVCISCQLSHFATLLLYVPVEFSSKCLNRFSSSPRQTKLKWDLNSLCRYVRSACSTWQCSYYHRGIVSEIWANATLDRHNISFSCSTFFMHPILFINHRTLSIYLSIYLWLYSPFVGPRPLFQFLNQ